MSLENFEYTSLADPCNDIRLIKFSSDQTHRRDSTLSCEIHNFKHKQCPPYLALSYAWGDEGFTQSIAVGDGTSALIVSFTVYDALRTLVTARANNPADNARRKDGDMSKDDCFWIWVDQICINQKDAAEKSQQVRRMRAIYNRASKVIAWLGPEADNSTRILEHIQGCAQAVRQQDHDAIVKLNEDRETLAALGEAFHQFCARDYWKRLWTVQEYAVARSVEIRIGAATVDAKDLDLFFDSRDSLLWDGVIWSSEPEVRRVDDSDEDDDDDSQDAGAEEGEEWQDEGDEEEEEEEEWEGNFTALFNCPPVSYVEGLNARRDRFQRGDSEDQSLLSVLMNGLVLQLDYNHVYTSFPQDRIFALLGLTSDKVPSLPDYELSCEEVYARTAVAMLQRGQIDILAFSQFPERGDRHTKREKNEEEMKGKRNGNGKLPTWAPDWRSPVRMPRGACIWETPETYFQASGTWRPGSANKGQRVVVKECGIAIELRGVIVDAISKVGTAIWDPNWLEPMDAGAAIRFLDEIKQFCVESERIPEGHEESHAASVAGADDEGWLGWPSIEESKEARREVFRAAMEELQGLLDTSVVIATKDISISDSGNHEGKQEQKVPIEYSSSLLETMRWFHSRRPFISHSGYVGAGAWNAAPGDVVCVFMGAHVPYIIRPLNDASYSFVGDTWVDGIMRGEVLLQNPTVEGIVLR